MKITVGRTSAQELHPPANPPPRSDLSKKPQSFSRRPPRRKTKAPGAGVRLKRDSGTPSAKRNSRPQTPFLRWKFDEVNADDLSVEEQKSSVEVERKSGRRTRAVISARKLAAGLWRMSFPEVQANNAGRRLGPESGGVHLGALNHGHHVDRVHTSPSKDLLQSPHSLTGPKHGLPYRIEPSIQFSNSAMEGATKWDPIQCKTSDELKQIFGQPKPHDRRASAASVISALETELEHARSRISELETERRSSKKKLEQFLQKLSEERAAWRSREHDKVRAIIGDMRAELSREKKNRQRLEIVNSKLVNELADAKLSAKHYLQEYEKERKSREMLEEVCDELANEIGEDKAEVEALKRESVKFREEVEEERKMLQMAEVWREERVQMKLVDAKVMLEEKYSQMDRLISELESFLNSGSTLDLEEVKKAEFLHQVAASVNMQDIRELTYEPPNPDDIFAVFEDNFGESNEREVEQCIEYSPTSHASKVHAVSPEVKVHNRDSAYRHSNMYIDRSGELEEDASEWETVSHPEDQRSSYSPEGSEPSVNKNFRVSRTGIQRERNGDETPTVDIIEVDPGKMRQSKKASTISKLWRTGDNYKIISVEGKNGRLSNGRLSNVAVMSPDHTSGKGGLGPQDFSGEWSSPDSGNPYMTRNMKGCIEWPRSAHKGSLKTRARMESQKIQLRQVLKQKI